MHGTTCTVPQVRVVPPFTQCKLLFSSRDLGAAQGRLFQPARQTRPGSNLP
jgi:hypothetical protein